MKKVFLFLVALMILNPKICFSKRKEMSDSLSHLAYSKTNFDSAMWLFQKAQKFIKNDTQKANFYFYKYFYLLKNNYRDSAENILDATFKYLSKTNQMEKLEWIFSTTYWVYAGESLYDKAMLVTKKYEKISKDLKDTLNYIRALIKLSNINHDLSNYEEGVKIARLAIKNSIQFNDNTIIILSITMLSMNFDDWGKYDSAIYYYNTILKMNKPNIFEYSQVYNNLGNTYLKVNQLDSSLKYIWLAYSYHKGQDRPYELATCLNNLGHIYVKKKDFKKAKLYLDSALYYATLSYNHEKLRDANYTLHLYYQEVGDFKNAFYHLSNYHSYKDSMLDVKRLAIIQNLENKAKESEYQNQLLKLENKTKARNLWIIIFSALLFIAMLIIRQIYLKRQKIAKESELNLQKERLRISRDLHDNIGAELTYITSFIDQQTYLSKDEQSKKELEKISESSRFAMAQMRETIWAIQNKDINIEELVSKLTQILEKYTKVNDILLKIKKSGENYILKPAIIISVIRVCQEAVNNSIKYASCKQIEIKLNAEEKGFFILIKDNGFGFDMSKIKFGNGINNMKERIEDIGGKIEITSKINIGTEIQINIPL